MAVVLSGSINLTGSINITAGITGSLLGTATTASYVLNAVSSSYAINAATASIATNFTASNVLVNGTITAQTLVVSTISSSVDYSSGSNIFGSNLTNTQQFTGSVLVTGSLNVNGFPVILSNQTGSLSVLTSSFAQTASYLRSLNQVGDVNKYTSSAIIDGYQLAWSSGSQQWAPAAGAAAKGVTRLFVSANRANSAAFYFTSITVTADSKASPDANTAFMVTSTLLSKVTVYLREDAVGTNSVRVDITKNPNGIPFSNATGSIANETLTLSQNTVGTYTFTGLTLNQFDSIHVKVTPTSSPGQMYGIVIVE